MVRGLHGNHVVEWVSRHSILAAKNTIVDALNFIIQNTLSGELISLISIIDTAFNENEAAHF